jgi:beta-lactamase regulating signal transducer with metallopeptidase domain
MDSLSTQAASIIMFYLIFFTLTGFLFLLNLRYTINYSYFSNLWIYDLFFLTVSSYLFLNIYFFIFFIFMLFNFDFTNRNL